MKHISQAEAQQAFEGTDLTTQRAQDLLGRISHYTSDLSTNNDSLTGGNLGLMIYYFNLYEATGNERHSEQAMQLLTDIFNRINNKETLLFNGSFSRGICGFNYCLNYLSQKDFIHIDLTGELSQLDEFLFNQARIMIGNRQNDYLHGSLGILFYFLSRLPDPVFEDYIREMLTMLYECIQQEKGGSWLENVFLHGQDKDDVNFSLSHGQCGFLMILLKVYEEGIECAKIEQLVTGGIAYMIEARQEIDFNNGLFSFFPSGQHRSSAKRRYNNRLAWCYGDLNQVLLLYKAAEIFDNRQYRDIGDLVGTTSAMRTGIQDTLCEDSHFCHGSSGLAQFYQTLHTIRPLQTYASSYQYWIDKTVTHLSAELDNQHFRGKELQLLDGLLGPSLTLLSFVTKKKLDWPGFFLLGD